MFAVTLPTSPLGLFAFWSGVALFNYVLTVILFRAACDLCSIETPSFGKACAVIFGLSFLIGPFVFGATVLTNFLSTKLDLSTGQYWLVLTAALVFVQLVIYSIAYKFILKTGFIRGFFVWLFQELIATLVYGVLILVFVGGYVAVQGIGRLL